MLYYYICIVCVLYCIALYCLVFVFVFLLYYIYYTINYIYVILYNIIYIYINGHLFCIFLCGYGHVIKVFINISIVKWTPMEIIQRVASCAAPVLTKEDAAMFLKSWTCDLNLNLNLCPYTNSYSNIPIASAKNRIYHALSCFDKWPWLLIKLEATGPLQN